MLKSLKQSLHKTHSLAEKAIEAAQAKALDDLKDHVVQLTMLATQKAISSQLDEKSAEKFTQDALKELNA